MPFNLVASSRVLWAVAVAQALAAPRIPASASAAVGVPPPQPPSGGGSECQRWCGGVQIPYPFGIGPDHCSIMPGFHLHCNDTGNGVLKPFYSIVEVVNISLPHGQMRVLNHISYSCYTATGGKDEDNWSFHLSRHFSFSGTSNRFTAIGCRTLAYISGAANGGGDDDVDTYQTGCVAMCLNDNLRRLSNGSCSGMGCCQTSIPPDLRHYDVSFDDTVNPSEFNATHPCSYAVLLEASSFAFSTAYMTPNVFNRSNHGQVPVLLDWVVGRETCQDARARPAGYACVSSHSECVDAASGLGYFCNCTKGYQGNPYVKGPHGCIDIDECKDSRTYPCHGKCINKLGTYDCVCPVGTQGNASIGECLPSPFGLGARLAIGIPGGVLVAVIAFLAVVLLLHKRSLKRQANFHQNGGQLLKQMLMVDGNNTFTIYDSGDIMNATRNFHKTNIVGEGAHGTVYKATLRVGSGAATATVAVKRCKEIDESRKKEFVQELVILCHLSHPNIVRLLGCCLECEAPMLVYEFVPNKSLNHLLHGKPAVRPVTLATRLRIATETAEALAHLHSSPHSVLHGDVKPENILLADGLTAKVSDFGCSTINDNVQVVPKGTLAYLDPEFLRDFQLTDKSDVYSFGVVLVELLTRKKPQSRDGKNLTLMFQESVRGGTLDEMLDTDIVEESSMVVILQAAELGSRCLAVPGTIRPPMEEVAQLLRRLQDQVLEWSQPPHEQELQDIGPTEMEMTTGYPTAYSQSDAPGGT